ncbi:MAG: AAA family ATPase [Myxococcales bacterium]|nr:AAA family ATPase [Myxococcales bacterium]MDH5307111.1 AAA family ATPase [Myxococcales bacterium]
MDYLHHFGLAEDPFRNDHHDKFLMAIPSQMNALRRLDRAVRQAKGLVCLIGGVGSGKTVLARKLYEDLEEEVFEAGMMVVLRGSADSDWLLTRFARQLGVEEPANERESLIGQIYERLAIIREDGRYAVLIVDDAQGLASNETLTELCGLVKLEYEDRRVLSVVLAGEPSLEGTLAANPALAHHVEVRTTLAPLSAKEVAAYVQHRIQRAGGAAQIVHPDAMLGLSACAAGAPGLINTLADNALFEAFLEGRSQITRSDVERAHAHLGWGALGATPRARVGMPARPAAAAASADLDSALEAVFDDAEAAIPPVRSADAGQTVMMDFEARPAAAKRPVPARAAAARTEIALEPETRIGPPPKDAADEVDEIFMELLED